MTPFFSIIIPVYNVAPYLRECLDSVLAQTFTDWEAICVDDGSTDGSGAILDEYVAKDKRFNVFHQPNAGVGAARNKGLDNANGNWVWFVDADDALHPNSLEFLCKLIHRNRAAKTISFTACREDKQILGEWEDLPDVAKSIYKDCIDSQSLRMHRVGAWTTIVRTDIAKKFSFRPYSIDEDVLYHLTVLWSYPETSLSNAPIYFYRKRNGSAVNGIITKKKVLDVLQAEYEMLQLSRNNFFRCKITDVEEYYRWNEDCVWNTVGGMFFRLPLSERQSLLSKWIELQKLQHEILAPKAYKQLVLKVLQIFPSASLCKLLVRGPQFVKRGFNFIRSKMTKGVLGILYGSHCYRKHN